MNSRDVYYVDSGTEDGSLSAGHSEAATIESSHAGIVLFVQNLTLFVYNTMLNSPETRVFPFVTLLIAAFKIGLRLFSSILMFIIKFYFLYIYISDCSYIYYCIVFLNFYMKFCKTCT